MFCIIAQIILPCLIFLILLETITICLFPRNYFMLGKARNLCFDIPNESIPFYEHGPTSIITSSSTKFLNKLRLGFYVSGYNHLQPSTGT